jgi:hypothetical protein
MLKSKYIISPSIISGFFSISSGTNGDPLIFKIASVKSA